MIWVEAAMAARSIRCSAGAAASVTIVPALLMPTLHQADRDNQSYTVLCKYCWQISK